MERASQCGADAGPDREPREDEETAVPSRQERLEEIRTAIKNDTYEVDPQRLARALIRHHIIQKVKE